MSRSQHMIICLRGTNLLSFVALLHSREIPGKEGLQPVIGDVNYGGGFWYFIVAFPLLREVTRDVRGERRYTFSSSPFLSPTRIIFIKALALEKFASIIP